MKELIVLDTTPVAARSARLFMQFMEPLGTTDPSVEAGWDFVHHRWKNEFLHTVRDLAPGCIRWGGIYSSFWKWREGIGPRAKRVPVVNLLWHGVETNQIGLHEIMDFCRKLASEPLMAVNFAGDGRPSYVTPEVGPSRSGDAAEAADLVSYCNDPDHLERHANGSPDPFAIKLWQIGNETSYPRSGERFSRQENARHFVEFGKAMKNRDPSIELIGWGDADRDDERLWADTLLSEAGDLVDFVAIHMMNQQPASPDSILRGRAYMDDRPRAWAELQDIYAAVVKKLNHAVASVSSLPGRPRLAITEGHLSLKPHNTSLLLSEWLAGLYSARVMNLYERNADSIEVATLADFFGSRWSVNAVMLGSPQQKPFLMPAGSVAKWYRRSSGTHSVAAPEQTGSLDIALSVDESTLYAHVVNTDLHSSVTRTMHVRNAGDGSVKIRTIAPGRLDAYVDADHPDTFEPTETDVPMRDGRLEWTFPGASVTLIEIPVATADMTAT